MSSNNCLSNELTIETVTSAEGHMAVHALRALCFMAEGRQFGQTMDDNDFHASHILIRHHSEPVAAARLRYFADFAVMERTCFRKEYRDPRLFGKFGPFIFDHVARKGYTKLLTYADPKYALVWRRYLKFEVLTDREKLYPNLGDGWVELVKYLDPSPIAITTQSSPTIISRNEGAWERPHALEV